MLLIEQLFTDLKWNQQLTDLMQNQQQKEMSLISQTLLFTNSSPETPGAAKVAARTTVKAANEPAENVEAVVERFFKRYILVRGS